MFMERQFTDFCIKTADGKKIKVHKNILASRSDYFYGMLNSGLKEIEDNAVKVTEVAAVMEEMLRYIYCAKIEGLPGPLRKSKKRFEHAQVGWQFIIIRRTQAKLFRQDL